SHRAGGEQARMGGPRIIVAVHTKAVVVALGLRPGLEAVSRAGYRHIVSWFTSFEEHREAVVLAGDLGLTIHAVSLPKARWADPADRARLTAQAWAVAENGETAISVILGDGTDDLCRAPGGLDALTGWLQTLG